MSHNEDTFIVLDLLPPTLLLGGGQNPNYIKSTLEYSNKMCKSAFENSVLFKTKRGGDVTFGTSCLYYLVILSKPCQIILLDETRLHHRSSKARTPEAEDFKFPITLTSQLQNDISTILNLFL